MFIINERFGALKCPLLEDCSSEMVKIIFCFRILLNTLRLLVPCVSKIFIYLSLPKVNSCFKVVYKKYQYLFIYLCIS